MSGRAGCEGRAAQGPWLGPEPHLGEPLAGAHWKDRQAGVGGPVAWLVFLLCFPVWVSAPPSLLGLTSQATLWPWVQASVTRLIRVSSLLFSFAFQRALPATATRS